MPEDGYDRRTCLAFDLGAVSFVNQFERMRDSRVEVPVTAEEKQRRKNAGSKMLKPEYTTTELMEMLGIDTREPEALEILDSVMDTDAWAAFDETLE